jgi:hypothetical protein
MSAMNPLEVYTSSVGKYIPLHAVLVCKGVEMITIYHVV